MRINTSKTSSFALLSFAVERGFFIVRLGRLYKIEDKKFKIYICCKTKCKTVITPGMKSLWYEKTEALLVIG